MRGRGERAHVRGTDVHGHGPRILPHSTMSSTFWSPCLCRDDNIEAQEKAGVGVQQRAGVLLDVAARYALVQLLQELGHDLCSGFAQRGRIDQEVVARIALCHLGSVDDAERGYSTKDQVLERL